MATTNYSLPTILGTNAFDLVTDYNALANATDAALAELAGEIPTEEITSLESSISTLQTKVGTVDSEVSTLQGQMVTANSNITQLTSGLQTANGNIGTLQTDLQSANGNISTLQENMTQAQEDIEALQAGSGSDFADNFKQLWTGSFAQASGNITVTGIQNYQWLAVRTQTGATTIAHIRNNVFNSRFGFKHSDNNVNNDVDAGVIRAVIRENTFDITANYYSSTGGDKGSNNIVEIWGILLNA